MDTLPPTPPLILGRYLVKWSRPPGADPTLREALVVEITPDSRWARVVWEAIPLDQEWVHLEDLQAAVQTKLPEVPQTAIAPPTGYALPTVGINARFPSPTQFRQV